MTYTPDDVSGMVLDALRQDNLTKPRTIQSDSFLIGMSEIGGCRNFVAHMLKQTPKDEGDEEEEVKWKAYIGSALGDALERDMKRFFGFTTQVEFDTKFPSDRVVKGHCDILDRKMIGDFKSVDGLEAIRKDGPSFRQKAQIMGYLLGGIQNGLVDEDAVAALIYVDRSGRNHKPVVWVSGLDMDIIREVDERLDDVYYAVLNGEDASRDEPIAWCAVACPFFSTCRMEHQPSGLVDDPGHLASLDLYVAGRELKKQGEQMMDEAKRDLEDVNGSTGELVVRHTWINETVVESYPRAGYWRMDIRKAPKPKAVK